MLQQSPGVEYVDRATSFIGYNWIGIATESLKAAIFVDKLASVPLQSIVVKGAESQDQDPQVIVVKTKSGPVGVIVSKLGEIPTIRKDEIKADKFLQGRDHNYIHGFTRLESVNNDQRILVVVDADEFVKAILGDSLSQELLSKFKSVAAKPTDGSADSQVGVRADL